MHLHRNRILYLPPEVGKLVTLVTLRMPFNRLKVLPLKNSAIRMLSPETPRTLSPVVLPDPWNANPYSIRLSPSSSDGASTCESSLCRIIFSQPSPPRSSPASPASGEIYKP